MGASLTGSQGLVLENEMNKTTVRIYLKYFLTGRLLVWLFWNVQGAAKYYMEIPKHAQNVFRDSVH